MSDRGVELGVGEIEGPPEGRGDSAQAELGDTVVEAARHPIRRWRRRRRSWHEHSAKAKVEVAVLVAMRFIIAKLRNRRFFSLADLDGAIRELVTALNEPVTRHLGASRRALFEEIERPAL